MTQIVYKEISKSDVESVRGMCEKLMEFQADGARIRKDVLASMNFENRFLPDFDNSPRKKVIVAYDGETPVGFSFVNVTEVTDQNVRSVPSWAAELDGNGFYPVDYETPKYIGTFKLLFVDSAYRGLDIGKRLSDESMNWLRSHNDVNDLWVFVANGNERVGKFYESYGFSFSHSVFGGFVLAYFQSVLS